MTIRNESEAAGLGADDDQLGDPQLSRELWESHARWWQDEFTDGADPEYVEQILPLIGEGLDGAERILDIGTGEGQAARYLTERGHAVVGIDPVWAQISVAERRTRAAQETPATPTEPTAPAYASSTAATLPFASGVFDGALACLVFEHIDDVDEAIREVSRVLRPGGKFLFLLNHPLLQTPQSGWIDDQFLDPPEQYWRIGPYLTESASVEEVQKDVFIRFIHRPLSRYINSLADASLYVASMAEPAPPPGFLGKDASFAAAAAIPRLLVLRCEKR